MRRAIAGFLLVASVAIFHLPAGGAEAQGIGLPRQGNGKPIEIDADDGIEWRRKTKVYIARGNARAAQGDVAIHADKLVAYYRDKVKGKMSIWRIEALGNVRLVTPSHTAFGDKGVYIVDDGMLVLTEKPGKRIRLVTPTDKITARDSLEYWEKRNMAVARGDAVVIRKDKRMRADLLTAHFSKDKDGKIRIQRVTAFDNVLISSNNEIVRAQEGVYDVASGVATLTGGVKITRGGNQLNGSTAIVNMNTGVSTIRGAKGERVKGLIVPGELKDAQPKPKQ